MKSVVVESLFLPPATFFSAIKATDIVHIERCEHYIKQTLRNRCYINTSQGREMLTVPVQVHGKTLITGVKIDYSQRWARSHWRALETAYGKAPFFEHYESDLNKILFRETIFLYDLNYALLSLCLKWLEWDKHIEETSSYYNIYSELRDIRHTIADEINGNYDQMPYQQVFGQKFVPGLSIIDLIFCKGPHANQFL